MTPRQSEMNARPSEQPILLTAKQVAALLQIGERTLWRHVSAGRFLSPFRVGGATRWPREAVERWVAEGCPAIARADTGSDCDT